MTTAVHNRADPKAVAVARAVYDAVRPDSVILFGSRARGDYRPDSDIDLLVISDDHASRAKRMKAQKTANETAHRIYGDYWMEPTSYGCPGRCTTDVAAASTISRRRPRATELT